MMRKKRQRQPSQRWSIPSLDAPPTPFACTCVKWARSSFLPERVKLSLPSVLRQAFVKWFWPLPRAQPPSMKSSRTPIVSVTRLGALTRSSMGWLTPMHPKKTFCRPPMLKLPLKKTRAIAKSRPTPPALKSAKHQRSRSSTPYVSSLKKCAVPLKPTVINRCPTTRRKRPSLTNSWAYALQPKWLKSLRTR